MRWSSLLPRLAPAPVIQQRLNACNGCPERRGAKCGRCGCWISGKIRLAAGKCPVGLWPGHID